MAKSYDLEKWTIYTILNGPQTDEKKVELVRFWKVFYTYLSQNMDLSVKQGQTKSVQYKDEVFDILNNSKGGLPLRKEELRKIQIEIEDLTMKFDEKSMFKSVPNIIKILIRKDGESAKDYLRGRELSKDSIELLSCFGQYTLEALIVHVLSMVFNTDEFLPHIRVASLVEQLESSVLRQASILKCRGSKKPDSMERDDLNHDLKSGKDKQRSKFAMKYPIGTGLVQFMEDRGLITLTPNLGGSVRVQKKKDAYYLPSNLFAVCNFDISLLPIKLNLPMVCQPLDWTSACPPGIKPQTLSDLSGGYLSGPSGEIYDRYRLLSTGNINHFQIFIGREGNYENLCRVMNKLQRQAFKINSSWLNFILDNEKELVESGCLMPGFLSSVNIKDVSTLLRDFHMKDAVINKFCSFNQLLNTVYKNIQRSRYERLIIKLAQAYNGYHFYLPAFLDFRGRIYRSGILHFHERDLSRSLIVFADSEPNTLDDYQTSMAAAAFHYQSFVSVDKGIEWFEKQKLRHPFIENSLDAKRPFQYLANLQAIVDNKIDVINSLPITQDASASAYQIMSYFLLDETLAKRTNLIPSSDREIQDVYSFILDELKLFMKAELGNNLSTIVCNNLTRQIVKGIFMPIIYGKTIMSTASDLEDNFSHFITHKECYDIASVCFKFWKTKYQGMECLIGLIRHIGWIASARDTPVLYSVPSFVTVQEYMIMESIHIWLYDGLQKKRRRVTLRVSSSKRDRRKTEISTFANFIHQKDAHIAMSVVDKMLSFCAPIYTVHDNFITTAKYSQYIPSIYSSAFRDMGPPLSIVNEFIYLNVIKPAQKKLKLLEGRPCGYFSHTVISKEKLHYYLKANVPEKISKKMMATWDERISGIMTSYENYTRHVCGHSQSPQACWQAHEQKWEKFKFKLECAVGNPSYSVHH